ncbi:glutathione S-transferase family protein [Sorangium sp. So ce204]|uniref:glutathione S-transferase family protein n=1 Tax=Sorangium sp. So ce204 TaxID=3133288 RepID=UPI003F627020
MIDLYTWTTPNGYKPVILLEELGLAYQIKPIDIGAGAQKTPEYLRINPNGKIPALRDHDHPNGPVTVFESGAILIYLAEKTGKLLPASEPGRSRVIEWLMFQMGAVGPMLGQLGHFRSAAPEKIPYAIERYQNEQDRIYKVLDGRLAESEYLADEYSIADIATFPWISGAARMGVALEPYPNLARWEQAIKARPAVARAFAAKIKP